MSAKRPILSIKTSKSEWLIEVLAAVLFAFLLTTVCYYWNDLPSSWSFSLSDTKSLESFGSKGAISFVTAVAAALYALMTAITFRPQTLPYVFKITEENADRQYLLARQFLRVLKLEVTLIAFVTMWACIQVGVHTELTVHTKNLFVMLIVMALTICLYVLRAFLAR